MYHVVSFSTIVKEQRENIYIGLGLILVVGFCARVIIASERAPFLTVEGCFSDVT